MQTNHFYIDSPSGAPSTFVIGDLHGGLLALKQVLSRAPLEKEATLIFLGDYVDGWSQSFQLVEFLIRLKEIYKCVFLRGNHDLWVTDWLATKEADPLWLEHGGKATVASYNGVSDAEKSVHLAFLKSTLLFFHDKKDRLFVHGGFTEIGGPARERDPMIGLWDRSLWHLALVTEKRKRGLPSLLSYFNEIFIGHTPTTQEGIFTPLHAANVWNVDTGAAFLGKLSILDVESKQYWQSDFLTDLYPTERGRN